LNPQTDAGVTYVSEISKKFNRLSLLAYLSQVGLSIAAQASRVLPGQRGSAGMAIPDDDLPISSSGEDAVGFRADVSVRSQSRREPGEVSPGA
jgi:hypothetical protein